MSVWLTVFTSLASAIIGGIIAPQLARASERRLARASVLEKLGEVEGLRWDDEPYHDFRRALVALQAAAIMARVPRKSVDLYIAAALAARDASETFDGAGPHDEPASVLLDNEKAEAVGAALAAVSRLLWHPWMGRLVRLAER